VHPTTLFKAKTVHITIEVLCCMQSCCTGYWYLICT